MKKLSILLFLTITHISTSTKTESSTDYIKFTEKCIVPGTQKEGVHRDFTDCTSTIKDLVSGKPFPRLCDEDTICRDLVCCPEIVPFESYQPDILTQLRKLIFLSPCSVDGKSGVFKPIENCDENNRMKNETKICKFDFCDEYVCCNEPEDIKSDFVSEEVGKFKIPRDWSTCLHLFGEFLGIIGETCTVEATGATGICRDPHQCPYYDQKENKGMNKTYCGYESCLDIICCPQIDFETTGKADHYCFSNQNYAYETIRSPAYIDKNRCRTCQAPVGGTIASSKEYPFMAALGFQTIEPVILWNCGGSLINNRFVITAAHCMESPRDGLVKFVRLGAVNVYEIPTEDTQRPKDYLIEELIPHPEYDPDYVYNDIGLLKLDRNVEFSIYIAPICLPTKFDISDKNLVAAGWGSVGFSKPKTDWLIQVKLEEFTYEECNKSYGFDAGSSLKHGILPESQICAGSKTEVRDTCPGDSGGPLMIAHPIYHRRHLLLGVTSFGKTCGTVGSPGIYTRVFAYLDWINEIIW